MRATAAAFTLSLATALTAFDGAASQVMADASLEYAIKAAYLPKFAPFIEWPNGAFTGPSAPLTICVIGNDPFGANLDKAVEGQRDGEHPLVVRRLPAPDPTAICQILFTGDAALAGEALEQMKTRPVVTVTDSGLSAHGIISFAIVGNHVRFDIDAAAADRVGLNISSKLLSSGSLRAAEGAPMKRARLGLPVMAALAAAGFLLAAGVLIARYEDRLYSAQQIKNADEQAHILAASVAGAVAFDDAGAAQEYVNALTVNPELQAAGVYDVHGRRIAQFTRAGASLPTHPDTVNNTVNGHIDVTVAVTQNGAALGTVFLRAAAEPAQRRFARYVGMILLVAMGALVIVVLSFSQSALTRRAEQLSRVNYQLQSEMAEREKTEEALRQAHKMEAVGQLSGGIAHDFNNLIMIVKGNLRLLRKRLDPTASQPLHYVAAADEALDRAAHLTQRILAFSRRQPLKPQPIQLSDLVGGIGALLHHSAGEKVEIETKLTAKWWTRCDVNQMENVLINLAINARDAMPDGGKLVIATSDHHLSQAPHNVSDFTPGDYVALSMCDNGTGMSEDVLSRAVDPFFTTKPLGKGTGLGLSMTFGFVRQSGGYLIIESTLGKGAEITLLMPRVEDAS